MEPLTIYPKHPETDAYRVGGSYAPYALVARANRFTDAELAAELHSQREAWAQALYNNVYARYVEEERSLTNTRERDAMGKKAVILYRFATLPHFDEGES